jgi:putative cell wall-binding protein
MWIRYWIRFDDGFRIDKPYRGKLPGFGGLYTYNCLGNRVSTPSAPCWSARMLFSRVYTNDGLPSYDFDLDRSIRLGFYSYHLDGAGSGQKGDILPWDADPGIVQVGTWNCVEARVKMNTPGVQDGILQGWVNGTRAFSKSDIMFRRSGESHLAVKSLWFDVYYGGSGTSPRDNSIQFDSLAAGPERLGCDDELDVERLWGSDRYETAARIAGRLGPVDEVFLASGATFPDAVVAGASASRRGAALLLTRPDSLPSITAEAIDALGVASIHIAGGPAAISDAVLDDLRRRFPDATVTRHFGASRYETAASLSALANPTAGVVYVGSGESFADALAAAPAAARSDGAVLLTEPTRLSAAAASEIRRLGPDRVVIVGGTAAVSEAVAQAITDIVPDAIVDRIGGSNRYSTAIALADDAWADPPTALVATGTSFADALASTPLAANIDSPLILVGSSLPNSTRSWIDRQLSDGDFTTPLVVGGPAAVPHAVLAAIDRLL